MIYLVQAEAGGPIKIGTAVDPERRLDALRGSCPIPLRMLRVLEGDITEELWLHKRFAEHRLHGEWFEPCDELVAFANSDEGVTAPRRLIRDARISAGLSRADMARELGLTLSSIVRLDKADPWTLWLSRLEDVARLTGRSVSYFLGLESNAPDAHIAASTSGASTQGV